MKRLNSKWSFMASGLNIAFAFIGAMWHSIALLLMGLFFAVYNYYIGEHSRRIEEDEQLKAKSETKE